MGKGICLVPCSATLEVEGFWVGTKRTIELADRNFLREEGDQASLGVNSSSRNEIRTNPLLPRFWLIPARINLPSLKQGSVIAQSGSSFSMS